MKPAGSVCLISGMAGSRQGWVEAPYVACPAGPEELKRHLHWIEPGRIALVPGLSDEQGDVPDVMRGEEVQIFGAMRLAGLTRRAVRPARHAQQMGARCSGGRVTGFRTFMTGEFYGLLSQHSILARTLEADAPLDEAIFLRGVTRAGERRGPAAQCLRRAGARSVRPSVARAIGELPLRPADRRGAAARRSCRRAVR